MEEVICDKLFSELMKDEFVILRVMLGWGHDGFSTEGYSIRMKSATELGSGPGAPEGIKGLLCLMCYVSKRKGSRSFRGGYWHMATSNQLSVRHVRRDMCSAFFFCLLSRSTPTFPRKHAWL